ncbi:hypothetical protein [Desulfonema magnum]|nr:hypothetical protein [Desulfonema magnum]
MTQFTCEDVFGESLGIVSEIMEKIHAGTKLVSDSDKISVEKDRGTPDIISNTSCLIALDNIGMLSVFKIFRIIKLPR